MPTDNVRVARLGSTRLDAAMAYVQIVLHSALPQRVARLLKSAPAMWVPSVQMALFVDCVNLASTSQKWDQTTASNVHGIHCHWPEARTQRRVCVTLVIKALATQSALT